MTGGSDDGRIVIPVDPEIIDLVPGFLDNRREDLAGLRAAMADGDGKRVREIGHRLKGMGGGYGFDYITTAGAAIEDAAVAGRIEDAREWIDGLADYLERVEFVRDDTDA